MRIKSFSFVGKKTAPVSLSMTNIILIYISRKIFLIFTTISAIHSHDLQKRVDNFSALIFIWRLEREAFIKWQSAAIESVHSIWKHCCVPSKFAAINIVRNIFWILVMLPVHIEISPLPFVVKLRVDADRGWIMDRKFQISVNSNREWHKLLHNKIRNGAIISFD